MKYTVSVVLPIYNEAQNIGPLIEATRQSIGPEHQIVVVDDSSKDNSAEVVQKSSISDAHLKLIVRQERGLTSAIQTGINAASGDIIIWLDADLSQHPSSIAAMLELMNDQTIDAVVASRFVQGGQDERIKSRRKADRMQAFLSRLINRFASIFFLSRFQDWTSGFIAIRSSVLSLYPLRGDYGEYFIDLMFRLLRDERKVVEYPYTYQSRVKGESKTGHSLGSYLWRGRKYILTILCARLR